MANFFSSNLRILVGKIESSTGTAESLVESDFDVRIYNPEVSLTQEVDNEASKYASGSHGEDEAIPGIQTGQITFTKKIHWAGDVTTEPAWWKFMNGCGLQKRVYPGSAGIALWPMKEYDEKTMTIWVYDIQRGASSPKATIYKFKGCMGNVVVTSEGIGMPWNANFTFNGTLYDIATNESSIPDLSVTDDYCPDKMLLNTFTIDSTAQKISSFSLDAGNDVQPVYDQSELTGVAYYGIAARAPRFSCNPLMDNSVDQYAYVFDGTNCPDTFAVSLAGNHSTLYIPDGQMLSAGLANREGLINWDVNIKCLINGWDGTQVDTDMSTEATWELRIGAQS